MLGCTFSFFAPENYAGFPSDVKMGYITRHLNFTLFLISAVAFSLTFVAENDQSKYARNIFEWMMFACGSMFVGSAGLNGLHHIARSGGGTTSYSIEENRMLEGLALMLLGSVGIYLLLNQLAFSDTPANWRFDSWGEGYFQSVEPKLVVAFLSLEFIRLPRIWADSLLGPDRSRLPLTSYVNSLFRRPLGEHSGPGEETYLLRNESVDGESGRRTPPPQQGALNDGVLTPPHSKFLRPPLEPVTFR